MKAVEKDGEKICPSQSADLTRAQVLAGEIGPMFSIVMAQLIDRDSDGIVKKLTPSYIEEEVKRLGEPSVSIAHEAASKLFEGVSNLPIFAGEIGTESGSIRRYVSYPSYFDTLHEDVAYFQSSFTFGFALPGYLHAKKEHEKGQYSVLPDNLTGLEMAEQLRSPDFQQGLVELAATGNSFWTKALITESQNPINRMSLSPTWEKGGLDWRELARKYNLQPEQNGNLPIDIDDWWFFNPGTRQYEITPLIKEALSIYRSTINEYSRDHPEIEKTSQDENSFIIGTTPGCPVAVKGGLLGSMIRATPEALGAMEKIAEIKENGRFAYKRHGNAILQLNELFARVFAEQLLDRKPAELFSSN